MTDAAWGAIIGFSVTVLSLLYAVGWQHHLQRQTRYELAGDALVLWRGRVPLARIRYADIVRAETFESGDTWLFGADYSWDSTNVQGGQAILLNVRKRMTPQVVIRPPKPETFLIRLKEMIEKAA